MAKVVITIPNGGGGIVDIPHNELDGLQGIGPDYIHLNQDEYDSLITNPIIPDLQEVLTAGSQASISQSLYLETFSGTSYPSTLVIGGNGINYSEGSILALTPAEQMQFSIYGELGESYIRMRFATTGGLKKEIRINDIPGIVVTDQINNIGFVYSDDMTVNQLSNDRAITDVGGVKQLINFIRSDESLTGAKRKGDILYGILDQYTGEEITLSKVTGTPTVDGIMYFQLGSEYFLRNYNELNIKWFGAKGDGTTDNKPFIDTANTFLTSSNGGTIFFPQGIYKITARIDTECANTRYYGDGATILYRGNKVGIVLMHDYCTVENLMFECDEVPADTTNNSAVFIQGAGFATIRNNKFKYNGNGVGIFAGNSYKGEIYSANSPIGNIVEGNTFESKGTYNGVENFSGVLMGVSDELPCIGNKIINNTIEGNFVTDHGIALLGCGNHNIISGNTINNVRSYGVMLYQTEFLDDYTLHHNTVTKNIIDGVGGNVVKGMGIYTQKAHYCNISNNTIRNAEIGADNSGVLAQAGISIDGGTFIDVIGNNVYDIQNSKPAIRINNSFFVNVTGNNYENEYTGISITESNDVNISNNIGKNTSMASLFISGGLTQSTLSPPYNSIPSGLNININGNTFINPSSTANVIDISGVSTYFIDGINIQNNNLVINGNGMNLVTVKNGTISGNTIISNLATGKSGIILNNVVSNILVTDNRIYSKSGNYTYGIYSDGATNKVLTNEITQATTPVFNAGSILTVSDTALTYNKNINVNNINTTGEVNGSFFAITTPGANRADFKAVGDALTLSTADGQQARYVYDSTFNYIQIGSPGAKGRFTAGSGGAFNELYFDSNKSIFSGEVTVPTATIGTSAINLSQLNNKVKGSTTTITSDGVSTVYSFPHGMATTPTSVLVTRGNSVDFTTFATTWNSTNVTLTYQTAPSAGSLALNWIATT